MAQDTRHDAWTAGESYDLYMGRWSRRIAAGFLDWLKAPAGSDWVEIGCGTGALSEAIIDRCAPRSLLGVEPSPGFLARVREKVTDQRASFVQGHAQDLPLHAQSRDVAVSGLVLNFVPDRARALAEMRRVLRPGGTAGFYVWDYPGGEPAFIGAFWAAAVALDPVAEDLGEARRFGFCTPEALTALMREAGFTAVESRAIEEETRFRDFEDFWRPFTLGAGPAPGYCASLEPASRERLRARLEASLPRQPDGSIMMSARAWTVRGRGG